jgi:hypothetical protein
MAQAAGVTTETGVVYVANIHGFRVSEVTAETLYKLKGNIHGRGLIDKLNNEIFPADPEIEAVDRNGDPAPELQQELMAMVFSEAVDIPSKMRLGFSDRAWYGAGFFNWVWAYQGPKLMLTALHYLPGYSFANLPASRPVIYSKILQGVQVDPETREIEYWQTQDETALPVKLDAKGVLVILDPADGEIAGDPIMRPVVPFLEMAAFCYNAGMQWVNQLGVPPMFIKITKPQPACRANDNTSDVDYAKLVLSSYGKDNRYPLRENMEAIWPTPQNTSQSIVEIINLLIKVIVDYTSPSNQIAKSGVLLGGSTAPEANLMKTYIRGHHRWLEAGFNRILRHYCDHNGYTAMGYSARFRIPEPDADRSAIQLEQAKEGRAAKTISKNEHRALIGHDTVSEEDLATNAEEWAATETPMTPFAFLTNAAEKTAVDHHERLARLTYRNLDNALATLDASISARLAAAEA